MNGIFAITLVTFLSHVSAFNVDYEYTVVKDGPKDSLFGFSVAEHIENSNKWILVGAPKANSSLARVETRSGGVFKCDATKPSTTCEGQIPFITPVEDKGKIRESITDQWLGVSLKSGKDYVVSCAHRFEFYGGGDFRHLEGICHLFSDKLTAQNTYKPCRDHNDKGDQTVSMQNYKSCLYGVGLDIHKTDQDDEFIGGAPGAKWFSGRYFRYSDVDDRKEESPSSDLPSHRDSYFGYAVAIGMFTSKTQKETALGGPRHQSFGKVLVYKNVLGADLSSSLSQTIPSSDDSYKNSEIEIASGFGISICAIDSDSNGYDELVVGAPFYAGDRKNPDTGMVYVYQRTETDSNMVLQRKLMGKSAGSNFGYSVANAGDLNLDGYPDLVVGAPHENNGRGAVYIYQGTKDGVSQDVTQEIKAENVESGLNADPVGLRGFGRSFAGGIDLDGNGYDDLLVGSYLSSQAVLLRARPIVIPGSSLSFTPDQISTSNRNCDIGNLKTVCFDLNFCHNITEPNNLEKIKTISIKYRIEADHSNRVKPRVKFKDSNIYEKELSTTVQTTCLKEQLHLVFSDDDTIAEYPDVTFAVSYTLVAKKPAKDSNAYINLDQYPILAKASGDSSDNVVFTKLTFKRECDKCTPDLKVLSDAKNYTLHLGSKRFVLNITIANEGADPAYAVKVAIKVPSSLEAESIRTKGKLNSPCNFPNGACENIIPKLPSKKQQDFEISLNTASFLPDSENNITITVSSVNEEDATTVEDNVLEITFDIKVIADIEMLGVQSTKQIGYKGEIKGESAMKYWSDAGKVVEHKYAVRNKGPDLLPKANLTIYWPYETISGKHLLYLLDVTTSNNVKCDLTKYTNVAKLRRSSSSPQPAAGALTDGSTGSGRVRRETIGGENSTDATTTTTTTETTVAPVGEIKPEKDEKSKIVGKSLDCSLATAKCIPVTCTILNLKSGDTESVVIKSLLWEPSLFIDYYGEVLTVVSNAEVEIGTKVSYVSDPNLENNVNELYTVVTPEVVKNKDTIPVWIIALAVIAGVILLALMIFGLHKLGFFKRNRGSQHSAKRKEQEKSLIGK